MLNCVLFVRAESEFVDMCHGTLSQCLSCLCKLIEQGNMFDNDYEIFENKVKIIEGTTNVK